MHILCLGLNHATAPIALRERLAFSEEQARAALARISCGQLPPPFPELLILSTCNRTELYAIAPADSFAPLEAFLSEARLVPPAEFQPLMYRFLDLHAVEHLFRVSAGLDSMVLGEPQILGQVTRALELARGQDTAGPMLNRLFQAAIHAGKRARTETAISRNSASVSSLAASVAALAVEDLEAAAVVVLGAGEMAGLTVESLRQRGVQSIRVINRTLERARQLASRWDAEPLTFEFLPQALAGADILIASTGAPHFLITPAMLADAMEQRPDRPVVLIDLAVPRDIDPACATIPGARLLDLDGLNAQLEDSLAARHAQVPAVEGILQEELDSFAGFLSSLDILPLIAGLYEQAESIRQAELQKTLRRLPGLSEMERARLEAMTQALVRKLLETPTLRLREQASGPHRFEYALLARSLFGLSGAGRFEDPAAPLSIAAD